MARGFDTTQWSVVAAAARSGDTDARAALAALCDRYREPLLVFAQKTGHRTADAEDLTQGFFVHLIEKQALRAARPERGRFRSFLLASFRNFISDQRALDLALKRGGGARTVSLDTSGDEEGGRAAIPGVDTPETLFERKWAHALLAMALHDVRKSYEADGSARVFDALQATLNGAAEESYATIAERLEMTEGAVKAAVHRLRQRFARALRAEVARTVDPSEVEDELRYLLSVLSA
jgi:RNA polymerase sigma-70 factor (ECF subfamily)